MLCMRGSGIMLLTLLCVTLLSVLSRGHTSNEVSASAEELGGKKTGSSAETELVEALEEILGKFENRVPEKRGSIPTCGRGERCAVKLGPRIGKLCDCGRGSHCNSFLLKCI
ncbi:cocaine- and amphetamine-regulated transcript protein-like [Scleropages formosus]|uniref:Cocaine- and amphetamine-regulated transcript protein-like n=1 Tax=Scleropages formosus TaxID=113540 RepID=A0A0P7VE89_SCLFO|nr:cocaine- and amphetamine-regulated transcript protein-like [Scleropages formosus]KPP80119.1 cocaine- and amphetamine-regulated transcript protein-like [Scleropages formosus]